MSNLHWYFDGLLFMLLLTVSVFAVPRFRRSPDPIDDEIDKTIQRAIESHDIDVRHYEGTRGRKIIEYDIELTPDQSKEHEKLRNSRRRYRRKTTKDKQFRWPDARIPFKYGDNTFTRLQKNEMREAMDTYSKWTCLTFPEAKSTDRNVMVIKNDVGCHSSLGMSGGEQILALDINGCRWLGLYYHELGHAIGLVHEHQLPDRTVRILWENVEESLKRWFEAYPASELERFNVPYDSTSIMHYGVYAFSKNDKKTMESNDPNLEQIAGHVYLKIPSFSDIKVINMMYECGKNCQNVACPPEGFVNKECKCVTPRSYHDDTCVDNPIHIDNCGAWKERGECENMSDWMFVNCRRTCNKCSRFGLK